MSISIITFANLGNKKKNLKTIDIEPVIDVFVRAHALEQVICQINEGFYFERTRSALPSVMRYAVGCLRRIGISFSRQTLERMFDSFAQHKLVPADATLFHGGYFLPKTASRARKLGAITIDLAVSAHLATNAALEREEFATFGIGSFDGIYTRLDRGARGATPFDYCIAMSEFARKSYIDHGFPAERTFVAEPDIDIRRFAPRARQEKPEKFRVLYLAHTQPLKGLHYLLDAWKSLELPDAELVIVGFLSDMPDTLREHYEHTMRDDHRIKFIAGTHDPEHYYHEATVLAFPSLTEGFSRVMLEAMACGLPVITTENARGLVEDGKTGFVVPIRDSKAIAEKIRYTYDHRDETAAMGAAARRAVETKKPFGEAVYEIYQEIMRREKKV